MGKEELFYSVQKETKDPIPAEVIGTIPEWIEGSLYRNGPAKFEFGNTKYNHWFDGMAMVHRFRISKGKVTYQNRFIESDTYQKNMKVDRIVVSELGTVAYPDPCKSIFERFFSYFKIQEASDNTFVNLFPVGNSLYACTESTFLNQIDMEDLSRVKKVDLNKVVSVSSTSAHPHIDTDGTVHMIGVIYGCPTSFAFVKVTPPKPDQNDFCEKAEIVTKIPAQSNLKPSYFHSFAMTENYYVFIEMPLVLNVPKILSCMIRKVPFGTAFELNSKIPTQFHVIDRKTGHRVNMDITYQADPIFTFHNINAYEENGQIVLDTVVTDDSKKVEAFFKGGLSLDEIRKGKYDENVFLGLVYRFILPIEVERGHLETNLVTIKSLAKSILGKSKGSTDKEPKFVLRCHPEIISHERLELPQINYKNYNTKKYSFVYGIGCRKTFNDCLVKINTQTKKATYWHEENVHQSEPIFVASPDATEEDDGVILSVGLTYGENRCAFLFVLDARSMTEIGRAKIDVKIGADTHGYFVNNA